MRLFRRIESRPLKYQRIVSRCPFYFNCSKSNVIDQPIENKIFEKGQGIIAGILIGVIAGVIVGVSVPVIINNYIDAPDFQVSMERSVYETRDNTSIPVYLDNLNYKKYPYAITLIAFNKKYQNSIEYGNVTEDIRITPSLLSNSIYLSDNNSQPAYLRINLSKNASGEHLVEVLALGGDGKERTCHFVLKIKK